MIAALIALAAACPSTDARQMLRDAGQGFNGRVLEVHADRLVIEAESRFDGKSIEFGEHVTVHGRSLPARRTGRIGIVVRRRGSRWTARRCDVIPGWRMANALAGRAPCPKPRVRIQAVTTDRRTATLRLRFGGDVTGVRINWAGVVDRHTLEPGFVMWTTSHTFNDSGRRRVEVKVSGAAGPGCGTRRASSDAIVRMIHVD